MQNLKNILSVDLEEWYHPEYVGYKAFGEKEEHIKKSFKKTLDLLQEYNAKATYFVLGESLEKYPEIGDEITEIGHEVAFHGYDHQPLWKKNAQTLKIEIDNFRSLFNKKCTGFRAPSFSLNNKTKWALKVLENSGYQYDSSIFPVRSPLYGVQSAPTRLYRPSMKNISKEDENSTMLEFPPLVYTLANIRIPVAGGFYLRFLPIGMVKRAIRKVNKQGFPAVLYFHNWEIDPETPRVRRIGLYKSFVTYHNLKETENRLRNIMSEFKFTTFRDYIEETGLA